MLQKGTGERFNYKKAVKKKFCDAICKKYSYGRNLVSVPFTGYCVMTPLKELSDIKSSAENAWADAWLKHVKENL